jgi:hypothetical protein
MAPHVGDHKSTKIYQKNCKTQGSEPGSLALQPTIQNHYTTTSNVFFFKVIHISLFLAAAHIGSAQ